MRIALVGPELEENLSLRYLHSSLVAAGEQGRIVEFHARDQIPAVVEAILDYDPGILGLSMVFTIRAREFVDLATELRRAGFSGHITAGGHSATFHADRILREYPAINSVVHGEGEETLVDLARNLACLEKVAGISYRDRQGRVVTTAARRNPDDLDILPFPTRPQRFHEYLGLPIANMLSGRGCLGNCSFCSIQAWYRHNEGRRFRQRHVENVAREMAELYHRRGVRIFNFHDDNFLLPGERENVERVDALARALDRAGVGHIGVQIKARPDSVTPAVLSSLRELGLFRVFLGIESNSVAGLNTLGRGISREQNHVALRLLLDAGIHTSFNLLMFDPRSTVPDLRENIAFIREYAHVPLNFGRTEVYAGTPLEEQLRAEGRLLVNDFLFTYRIADDRAQRAFEMFKDVFTPRNFRDDGMNLEAMYLDYHFHLLCHFRPDRANRRLEQRTKDWIRALNTNNADLLDRICGFVSDDADPSCPRTSDFSRELSRERAAFDRDLAAQARTILAEIKSLAEDKRSATGTFAREAASAAAIALIVTVGGCGTRTGEKGPGPETVQPDAPASPLSDEDVAIVEKAIAQRYGAEIMTLLFPQGGTVHTRIWLELSIDEDGKVRDARVALPRGDVKPRSADDLAAMAKRWRFHGIHKAGRCRAILRTDKLPRQDWQMCEMIMGPMEE